MNNFDLKKSDGYKIISSYLNMASVGSINEQHTTMSHTQITEGLRQQ